MSKQPRPPLSPFARIVHWGMVAALVLTLIAARRWLGAHAVLGMITVLTLVVWVAWLALFRRQYPPASPIARYLLPAIVVVFALIPVLGLIAYGGKYASGPLSGLLNGWTGLGQAAAVVHGPLVLLLLALLLLHTIVAAISKLRQRRAA